MPRCKVFDEDKALESAMLLFWKNGYEASSMQALEQAMGLKRSSIYNSFGNKRALFSLALERYMGTVLTNFITVINAAPTAEIAIKHLLDEVMNLHFDKKNPGGCMVVLSILENHQHDKKTMKILDSVISQLNTVLTARLDKSVEEGELTEDFQSQQVADEVTAMFTGLIVMAKANFGRENLESLIKTFVKNRFS